MGIGVPLNQFYNGQWSTALGQAHFLTWFDGLHQPGKLLVRFAQLHDLSVTSVAFIGLDK
jgi:hypothetical protein